MTRRLRRAMAGAALALAAASAAFAAQPVSLKDNVSSGAIVTLGDLFENAGAAGPIMVGYGAPAGLDAVLDAGEVRNIASAHGLDWANPGGLRRIIVHSDSARSTPGAPSAARMVDALTYTRNLAAGEVVQPQDLAYAKVPAFSAPADMPRDAESVIGKMARRPLRLGAPAATRDVVAAQVIKRDDAVQVAYRAGAVSLILQGKAMSAAALGETVGVLNPVSKKVIQAVAVGPGEAVVGPEAEQMRAAALAGPTQFAANR